MSMRRDEACAVTAGREKFRTTMPRGLLRRLRFPPCPKGFPGSGAVLPAAERCFISSKDCSGIVACC